MPKKTNLALRDENIQKVVYDDEMKQSFIDYAMSVITQRALPDVRDGFKPVHRRVLYAMDELGLDPSKSFLKSARIVGDVLGKYHPHGDSAVYETMVRMTQDFSMLLPLVQGHGNFGSIDGDSAAAMRYTEAKLSHPAIEMLKDLEKKVVDFQENYDGKLKEPVVLPARFPNLLVNGASGIAVGMATSIPSHNLNEAIKGILHYIDNPDITVAKLMKHIKGPDFPTGGIIINKNELLNIYETGTGRVRIRSKLEIENAGYGRSNVVITEIPYTQAGNKTKLIEKMEELARDKKLDEVSDIRDESSKDGIRIVLEVKKGVDIDDFLNKLYKKTALEDTFKVNFLALVDGKPQILNLKQVIHHFVEFQKEITRKKHEYLLAKANNEQEVLEGLIKAHDIIDLIIEILRGSKDVKMAKACMMQGVTDGIAFRTKKSEKEASKLNFTERQADAILDMRLQKLISLELDKLNADYQEIRGNIKEYEDILGNESTLLNVIKDYLQEIAKKFGQKRKTQIDEIEVVQYVEKFKEEELYVLMDRFGYIKTTDVTNYNRSSDDTVKEFKHTFLTMNTDKLYLFTKEGNLHTVKLADVPKGKVKDKGVPIQTITKLGKEEEVLVESFQSIADKKLMFITKQGMVKWLNGSEFDTNRSMSSATKLEEGDELLSVQVIGDVKDYSHIVLVSNKRFALKIAIEEIPELKKTSKGVKTISLTDDDTLNQVYLLRSDDKESVVEIDGKAVDLVSMKTKKRNQVGVKI